MRHLDSVRVRLLLTLGLLLAPGALGTYALWTDTATVSGIQIESGTFDLAVGGGTADQLTGPGGTWNYADLGVAALLPGESIARPVTVRNAGSTPLRFVGTVSAANNDFATHLVLTVTPAATVANTGTQAGGNRAGSCTGGGADWWTEQAVSTTAQALRPAGPLTLQPAGTSTFCVRVALAAAAPNTVQGRSTTLTLVLSASQVS